MLDTKQCCVQVLHVSTIAKCCAMHRCGIQIVNCYMFVQQHMSRTCNCCTTHASSNTLLRNCNAAIILIVCLCSCHPCLCAGRAQMQQLRMCCVRAAARLAHGVGMLCMLFVPMTATRESARPNVCDDRVCVFGSMNKSEYFVLITWASNKC